MNIESEVVENSGKLRGVGHGNIVVECFSPDDVNASFFPLRRFCELHRVRARWNSQNRRSGKNDALTSSGEKHSTTMLPCPTPRNLPEFSTTSDSMFIRCSHFPRAKPAASSRF